METVRAKFYISAVNRTASASYPNNEIGSRYASVTWSAAYSPNPQSENHTFWKASPNGSLTMSGPIDKVPSEFLEPGSFFYIDTTQASDDASDADDIYRLDELGERHGGGISIALRSTGQNGWYSHWTMSIDNEAVFDFYRGRLGKKYKLVFLPAEKNTPANA